MVGLTSPETKKPLQETEVSLIRPEWSGPGSNRRHMDFQSIALPTELPDQPTRAIKAPKNGVMPMSVMGMYWQKGSLSIQPPHVCQEELGEVIFTDSPNDLFDAW